MPPLTGGAMSSRIYREMEKEKRSLQVLLERIDSARGSGAVIDLTPDTLTVDEVGAILRGPSGRPMSRPTVRSHVARGEFERLGIRTIRLGRSVRFVKADVLRLLEGDPPPPEV